MPDPASEGRPGHGETCGPPAHAPATSGVSHSSPPRVPPSPLSSKRPLAPASPRPSTVPAVPAVSSAAPTPNSIADHVRVNGRASIACLSCRSSKTKCSNDGGYSDCKACIKRRRQCVWDSASTSHPTGQGQGHSQGHGHGHGHGHSRPIDDDEASAHLRLEGDGAATHASQVPRKRMKTEHSDHRRKAALPEDPLASPVLSYDVWVELYTIFRQQCSADLPFIHASTFLVPPGHPHASRTFLLAFLALTASSHPKLVKLHSNPTDKPLKKTQATSDYYYEAASAEVKRGDEYPTLDRIQTLLMLGLYEWSTCRGIRAWQHIGTAARDAILLGLFVDERVRHATASKAKLELKEDRFIEEEKRRRTFWACFIMDRYISGGPNRPANINLVDVTIQLPCSERALKLGKPVKTNVLTSELVPARVPSLEHGLEQRRNVHGNQSGTGESAIPWEQGPSESILCHYIRAMELWKRVIQWSVKGGRRQEILPPWDPSSFTSRTEAKLAELKALLPPDYENNVRNTKACLVTPDESTTTYILVHLLHHCCIISLHREYIPWIAAGCKTTGPRGPLDEPTFPIEQYGHAEWWRSSTEKLWEAARNISDLLEMCEKYNYRLETPLATFLTYQQAFCGVYIRHFPWMDTKKCLIGNWRTTFDILDSRAKTQILALSWCAKLGAMNKHLATIIQEIRDGKRRIDGSSDSSGGDRALSLAEGGEGGMLEDYCQKWEMAHKMFGDHQGDIPGDVSDLEANARLGPEDSDPELSDGAQDTTNGRPDSRHENHPRRNFPSSNFTAANPLDRGRADFPNESVTPHSERSPAPYQSEYLMYRTSTARQHEQPQQQQPHPTYGPELSSSHPVHQGHVPDTNYLDFWFRQSPSMGLWATQDSLNLIESQPAMASNTVMYPTQGPAYAPAHMQAPRPVYEEWQQRQWNNS